MQTKSNETWEQQREREQREKRARHLATLAAARTVAGILNQASIADGTWAKWALEPNSGIEGDECRAVLRCGGRGHRIAIDGDNYGHSGKFYVHGWYDFGPSELNLGMPYGLSSPSISVSQSRGGEVLGKEIVRRFMGEFYAVVAKLDERTRAAADFRGARMGILERLADVVATTGERVAINPDRGDLSLYGREGERTIDVHGSRSSVDMKINDVSEETAAAIIRLVRGLL